MATEKNADRRSVVEAAERAVIGSILAHPTAIAEALECLDGEQFADHRHESIFIAAAVVHLRGAPADVVTVFDQLERDGKMRGNLTQAYVLGLATASCLPAQISHHAEIITREAARRRVQSAVLEVNQAMDKTDGTDLSEVAAKLIGRLTVLTEEIGETRGARRLVLTPASEIKVRPVRWLWDTTPEGTPPTSQGRIPMSSLCIAAGGPGLGKSQFAAWMAARITTGTLPGELHGSPRSVIYAATEDSWSYTIAPRLIAAGADLSRVFRIDVADDNEAQARLTLPVDISLLGRTAEEYSVGLVVADPLLSLIDDSINDYRQKEVRKALEPLAAAADKHRFTVLGLAHFTKAGGGDPLNRISGSGAFGQLIRSSLAFAEHEGDGDEPQFVLSLAKNNLGRKNMPSYSYTIQPVTITTEDGPSYVSRFVLGEETSVSVGEVLRAEGQANGDRSETNETVRWLKEYMEDNGGTERVAELKRLTKKEGISDAALYRAKEKLKIRSKVSGFGREKGATWYLPSVWDGPDEG